MQENNEAVILSEKKNLTPVQTLLGLGGGLLFLGLIFGGWFWYQNQPTDNLAPVTDPISPDEEISFIYFSGIPINDPDRKSTLIHELNVASKEVNIFYDYPIYNLSQIADAQVIGIIHYNPELPGNSRRLAVLDVLTGNFEEVPGVDQAHDIIEVIADQDTGYYAYTHYNGDPIDTTETTDEIMSLTKYNIVLRNINDTADDASITITSAANPVFIENGEAMLFSRPDGIYYYNIASSTESQALSSTDLELSILDDFVALNNGDRIILTPFPIAEFVTFTRLTERDVPAYQVEDVFSGTEGFGYTSLLLHPDETQFAAIKQIVGDDITENPEYFEVEIRSVADGTLLDTIRVDAFAAVSSRLGHWR